MGWPSIVPWRAGPRWLWVTGDQTGAQDTKIGSGGIHPDRGTLIVGQRTIGEAGDVVRL